jgi:hypothetical protein
MAVAVDKVVRKAAVDMVVVADKEAAVADRAAAAGKVVAVDMAVVAARPPKAASTRSPDRRIAGRTSQYLEQCSRRIGR